MRFDCKIASGMCCVYTVTCSYILLLIGLLISPLIDDRGHVDKPEMVVDAI